jgi:peroxiredoxin
MRFGNAIGLLVLLLPGILWILGPEVRFPPMAQSQDANDLWMAKLGIEPLEKRAAPDLQLKDVDGNMDRLHDFKGKVVLLNFWATWCPSCRFEMPSMETLHKELSSRGLAVVAVALQDSTEDVRAFYNEYHLSFPALLDHDAAASDVYEVWSLPTTFVIGKQGFIVGKVVGYRDWNSEQSKNYFLRLLSN